MAGQNHKIAFPWYQQADNLFWLSIAFSLLCFSMAIAFDQLALIGLPFGLLFVAALVYNYHWVFYLFFALLPFSIEVSLPGGFGTDLPTEPIMWILTGVFLFKFLEQHQTISIKKWLHPISIILLFHLLWIYFISIYSVDHTVSIKYALAKTWYVLPFYFLSLMVFDKGGRLKIEAVLKVLWWSLSIALLFIMVRHALEGFSFKSINEVLKPIFRNHVNYAVLLVSVLPYLIYLYHRSGYKKRYLLGLILLLTAIYFSYTRAAYVCVFLCAGMYFVMRFRFMKLALLSSVIAAVVGVGFMMHKSKYLEYRPDYQNTIAHYKFDNLIEATYKMEDISTMERLYRWVAGFHMVADKPIMGFGPGTFYPSYMDYTVRIFETYVSDNPEKSGMHNNYLLVFVEQGVFGFLIMLMVCFIPLLYAEQYYHQLADPDNRHLILAAACSIAIVCTVLLINELLEADKVGPLFFISLAIITTIGVGGKKNKKA